MPIRVAVQMDPVENIDIAGDSTFAMLLEAQARDAEIFYYLPQALSMHGGAVMARGQTLRVKDEVGRHFEVGEMRLENLADWDVVLLRQDPPFNMAYITTTHLLERIHPKTLVVNNPLEVRNAPEKIFVTDFADLMPPTLITLDRVLIDEFRVTYGDIIIKPLYGNGGAGVFRLRKDDSNLASLLEVFADLYPEPFIVQQYLPDVRKGDKRIILVDGEPVGALNRVPAKGETRSNMHVGGRPEASGMTDREREICARIGPELKARGMIFVGIDVIGDVMTEINVTSPTGIREIAGFGGNDISALIWDAIESKLN